MHQGIYLRERLVPVFNTHAHMEQSMLNLHEIITTTYNLDILKPSSTDIDVQVHHSTTRCSNEMG